MRFEFDDKKSKSNKIKHGIDFIEAQYLWNDPDYIEIPAKTEDEPRSMVIGMIEAKAWAAIITYRNGITRLISVRPANKREVEIYEGK